MTLFVSGLIQINQSGGPIISPTAGAFQGDIEKVA
jgi:hypothetical protein